MKKVLLATTALVAMSGAAFADISIGGSAEIGIYSDDIDTAIDGNTDGAQFHTDVDINFSGSGETDSGLSFGMSVDLDEGGSGAPAHADDSDDGGATMFVSGSFGTFTLGDTDGAYDKAMKEAIIGGAIKDNHEHEGYNGNSGFDAGNDNQVARYDYSFDSFTFSASIEQDDNDDADDIWGIGVAGSFGDIGVGLGFQDNGTDDIVGISVDASFGDIQVIANWSDGMQGGLDQSHVGLAVGYTSGPLLVAANWGEYSDSDANGIGLVVNYDLGGGAKVQFGYGSSDIADTNTWSLGLGMSF